MRSVSCSPPAAWTSSAHRSLSATYSWKTREGCRRVKDQLPRKSPISAGQKPTWVRLGDRVWPDRFTARLPKPLIINGAGEGNRTLVIIQLLGNDLTVFGPENYVDLPPNGDHENCPLCR